MVTSNSLPVGTILKGLTYSYRIEKTLGQGSFGITYLASVKMAGALGSIDANIRVAIKEFFMRDINGRSDTIVTSGSKDGIYDDYKRKFKREALNLSKLEHPNIIKVIESFEANNTVYYVMEYIGGGSLDDYIARNKGLEESEAIRIVKQIGSALSYMHSCKMLHLDLKPSNVMMKESGDVVLIDFGLSKQYDSQGNPEASTKVGAGTPGYAPIEQANYREGKGFPVTMDVYALGGTMFKMLTGERPPEASEILNEGFPKKDLALHNISRELIDCIEKAMWPTKKDRFQSINEFVTAIKAVGNGQKNFDDASVKVLRVDDSDLKTEIDDLRNGNQNKVETKRIKFIFKEGDKEIPNSLIAPILILPGRQIPLIDKSYTFFGKEIYDEKKIISKSLDYRLKRGCEKIDLSHVNDVYIIQVEHIFSFKISFAPYDKPKNVILSSSHGVFSNYDVRGVLVATLPGYIEDYSYAIESKYYEYQSGKLSSLLKYVRLTSRFLTTPSTNNIDSQQRISPSNKNGIKNSPTRLSNYTPWILLGIGFVVAVLFLVGNGAIGCGRIIEPTEVMDLDSISVDTLDYDYSLEDSAIAE